MTLVGRCREASSSHPPDGRESIGASAARREFAHRHYGGLSGKFHSFSYKSPVADVPERAALVAVDPMVGTGRAGAELPRRQVCRPFAVPDEAPDLSGG